MYFFLQWHLTKRCNLRCKHCYLDKHTEEASLQELKKYFLAVESLANSLKKKLRISITGGEPLIHPHIFSLLEFINNKDVVEKIQLVSNGTLINDEILKKIKKYNIRKIQISLDGLKEEHERIRGDGTFKRTINGIKIARKNGFKVVVHMVVNKNNLISIEKFYILLMQLGVNEVRFSLLVPTNKETMNMALKSKETKDLFNRLEKLSQNNNRPKILKGRPLWCIVNRKAAGICNFESGICLMPRGDIFPCSRLPISIGNINKQNILKIWRKSRLIQTHRDLKNLKGKCASCKYVYECGGCRALAFAYFNDTLEEDPTCWLN